MPEKPKGKECDEPEKEPLSKDTPEKGRRSYYYDDAHGYETYVPDEDDDAAPDEIRRRPDLREER